MENCLTLKNPKMCDPIIVNPVVKMDPIQRHIPISLLLGSTPPSPFQSSNTENAKGVMYGQA